MSDGGEAWGATDELLGWGMGKPVELTESAQKGAARWMHLN
jgi:hypothetical protein